MAKDLCLRAREHWGAGRADAAIREALAAHRLNREDVESKVLLASLICEFAPRIGIEMRPDILRLLQDRDVAPEYISVAGWLLILREPEWKAAANNAEFDTLAARLDADELALALLKETPVFHRDAERILTRIRRWLLLSGQWRRFGRLREALAEQAVLNGGAWPFADSERALFQASPNAPIAATYLPAAPPHATSHAELTHPLMRAVAEDYERWPYPVWKRTMVMETQHLPNQIRALDPNGPNLPIQAKMLIAGCGTGSEAAQVALEYPDAKITAIDISEASLAYAQEQCAALGISNLTFARLDLHDVAALNEQFDAIFCSGVLHHLPDPEAGWARLTAVLREGGVMRIMLYSRIARQWVTEARTLIGDLAAGPINDDVLRQVRQRFMDRSEDPRARHVLSAYAFATLSGTHDLLLHRQEDSFDLPRIGRALDRFGLRLLSFVLPTPDVRARYDARFPSDPTHRNLESLALFERGEPLVFVGQYTFWCRSGGVGLNAKTS